MSLLTGWSDESMVAAIKDLLSSNLGSERGSAKYSLDVNLWNS